MINNLFKQTEAILEFNDILWATIDCKPCIKNAKKHIIVLKPGYTEEEFKEFTNLLDFDYEYKYNSDFVWNNITGTIMLKNNCYYSFTDDGCWQINWLPAFFDPNRNPKQLIDDLHEYTKQMKKYKLNVLEGYKWEVKRNRIFNIDNLQVFINKLNKEFPGLFENDDYRITYDFDLNTIVMCKHYNESDHITHIFKNNHWEIFKQE